MKLVFAALSFIVVFLASMADAFCSTQAASASVDTGVRVRLFKSLQEITITGQVLRYQTEEPRYAAVAIPRQQSLKIKLLRKDGKSFWSVQSSGTPEKLIVDEEILVRGEGMRLDGKAVPRHILIQKVAKQKMDVVGLVPLDDYIVGVLASEMPLTWPLETLKAQAVAARSYALAVIEERKNKSFHVESSIMDQVFRPIVEGEKSHALVQKAVQAVAETKHLKLYMKNSPRVLKAFFHADCGGKTTTAKSVWNSSVNSGVTVDSSCPTSPSANWNLKLSKVEMASRLKLTDFSSISLIRDKVAGRIQSVKVALLNSKEKIFSANEFRQLLGFQELKSSLFEMHSHDEGFDFQGRGFGHGVGLCQWGSRHLGKKGYNFRQILKHYYPLAEVR